MPAATEKPKYNLNNPFMARLVENRLLNEEGTKKETRHLVVDLSGSGLTYSVGDSLGVYPTNRPDDVEHMITALQMSGREMVEIPKLDHPIPLREALESRLYYLAGPTVKLLKAIRERVTDEEERGRLDELLEGDQDKADEYLYTRHYADVLDDFPSARFEPQEVVKLCKRLVPRLYSIASSPLVQPDKVDLTVAAVRYELMGRDRVGVASTFSIDRVALNEAVLPVFVAESHFGLPEDDTQDIIMIGPGTGVAPFRGFLQEREARGASGRNWLFFGEQRKGSDFLYKTEMERWEETGLLTHLDCAWSRDQEGKIYVQHLLWQKREEFWKWFDDGAVLYVCGDKARMSRDVEDTLVRIAIDKGAVEDDPAAIKQWIKGLKKDKRYQLDVY